MSPFDHPAPVQQIGQHMNRSPDVQPEAMQGFGEWPKPAMTPGARPAEGLTVTVSPP